MTISLSEVNKAMEVIIFIIIFYFGIGALLRKGEKANASKPPVGGASAQSYNAMPKLERYKLMIDRDRYQSIDKMARELGTSRAVVINDIKQLMKQGMFQQIMTIDEVNGKLIYGSNTSQMKAHLSENKKEHDHAYVHKVQPVDEATVVKERREAEKQSGGSVGSVQMTLDLEEDNSLDTSSSWDDSIDKTLAKYRRENESKKRNDAYRPERRLVGRNGDYGATPNNNEMMVKCGYCGAINILPRHRQPGYSCYFCREQALD